MKKILLVAACVTLGFLSSKAQFTFGAGVNVGLPVGDASDVSSFGLGAELQGEYKFAEKVSGIGTTGYTHFFGKDLGGGVKFNYGAIPVLAGARVYPTEFLYVGAQAGYSFYTGDASEGGFTYKPQVGYDAQSFQLGLSYNAITRNSHTNGWLAISGIIKLGGK